MDVYNRGRPVSPDKMLEERLAGLADKPGRGRRLVERPPDPRYTPHHRKARDPADTVSHPSPDITRGQDSSAIHLLAMLTTTRAGPGVVTRGFGRIAHQETSFPSAVDCNSRKTTPNASGLIGFF